MAPNNTVKFNVGGKLFEVSRDLIDKQSETMLGKLVSEAWQEDPEETVFIDRDGELFAHVLNYLRYGSIELPPTIPKAMFDRDLDFYGLVPGKGEVKDHSIADVVESLRKDRDTANSKHDVFLLAAEAHHQYVMKVTSLSKIVCVFIGKGCNLYDVNRQLLTEEIELFKDYLGTYFGMRLATAKDDLSYCNGYEPSFGNKYSYPIVNGNGYFCVSRKD